MIVWTQQKLEFWEELEHNGVVYCSEDSYWYKEYSTAYDWITKQIHIRISPPPIAEIKHPLWCWTQYNSYKSRKPKFSPQDGNYSPQVLIEADIPDNLLLQSNFMLWTCCCLNGYPIADKRLDKDMDIFRAAHNIKEHNFNSYSEELKERIMKSWNVIFDLNYRNRRYEKRPRRNKSIQATFWLLRKEWVKSIRFFIPQ